MRVGLFFVSVVLLTGCTATFPVIHYKDDKSIIIEYDSYGMTPILTEKARALADIHCKSLGKQVVYVDVYLPNPWISAKERHNFQCI